jgi:hypothetical protein
MAGTSSKNQGLLWSESLRFPANLWTLVDSGVWEIWTFRYFGPAWTTLPDFEIITIRGAET